MGCGESKLAVATSNTILRRKKSSVADPSKKSKDIETVLENNDNAANSTVQQQQQRQQHDQQEGQVEEDNVVANNVGGSEASAVGDDVNLKDIKVTNKDGEDGGKEVFEKGNKEEHDEVAERLISHGSPNRFFSSRKLDEEGIDGIISEGRSGTSDYYTPRHGSKGSFFKVDDDIAEGDNELDLPAETEAPVAETQKRGTEEPVKKPEENLVKETEAVVTTTVEAEVAEAAEPKASIPAEDLKN